jgi:RNA polymerase sigma-70 factor (ECF subfamily)
LGLLDRHCVEALVNDPISQEITDARRRFDEDCERLRPDLHRFCTRMAGNPCDGEDIVHDTLVLAFYRLAELRDSGSLRSWLFRIAHNKCIDLLRTRRRLDVLGDLGDDTPDEEHPMDERLDRKQRTDRVLANIVTELPPRERACVVLRDVLDCSLEDTAEIVGSTVGAVKAALHRGRDKLERAERAPPRPRRSLPARHRDLIQRYLAAFNQRDWDAVRSLLTDEARLEVVHRSEGPFGAGYFTNYGRLAWPWKLALAHVDGVESIVHFRQVDGTWLPHAIIQLEIDDDKIAVIRDYVHVDYLLRDSVVE